MCATRRRITRTETVVGFKSLRPRTFRTAHDRRSSSRARKLNRLIRRSWTSFGCPPPPPLTVSTVNRFRIRINTELFNDPPGDPVTPGRTENRRANLRRVRKLLLRCSVPRIFSKIFRGRVFRGSYTTAGVSRATNRRAVVTVVRVCTRTRSADSNAHDPR